MLLKLKQKLHSNMCCVHIRNCLVCNTAKQAQIAWAKVCICGWRKKKSNSLLLMSIRIHIHISLLDLLCLFWNFGWCAHHLCMYDESRTICVPYGINVHFYFKNWRFFFICLAFRSTHLFMRINRSQIIESIRVLHLNKYWMKNRKIPFKMNAWSHYSSIKLSICTFCIWHIENTRSFPIELAFGVA